MIYCVEDDSAIRDIEVYALRSTGFEAEGLENGEQLFEAIAKRVPELIILDVMLPGEDGLEILKRIRFSALTRSVPVIMATARGEEYDKITGLDSGADDYLVKPFALKELEARIRALIRARGRGAQGTARGGSGELRYADVVLDVAGHRVSRQGRELRVSPTGFRILCELMRVAPALLPREELEQALWGDDPPGGSALRTHIHELRQVLDKPFAVPLLQTVSHVGYRLTDGREEA